MLQKNMQNNSFSHSVKVPKLYKCAAKISQEVARGGASIKQLVYEKTHFNTKALYALVVTTFQKAKEIDLLLKRTKLLEKESRLDPWLAKILISELLWGKKQLPKSEAKPIQTLLAYEQAFHAHLSDSSGDTDTVTSKNYKKPRYVRVNTLINPFNEALELFQEEGWTLQTLKSQNDYGDFLEQVSNLEGDFMLKDLHIPDLLIFPSGTEFYNHPGYKKGAIVLQDKASCLPVHILSPLPGSVVLDMCAAPGMKTTQLATMIQNEGTVYAVERDPKRFQVLNKIVESSGSSCIKTINKDVLDCGDSDFPDVEYILVDPSCSASGMTDRLEIQQNQDNQRLQKLAGFQIKILRSALTRYPKVKRVVYSTCSLYPEENEDVVRQVLETNNKFKLVPADNFLNNSWKNYGSADYGDIGKSCLYARPEEDLTNGFFVAVFERMGEGEENKFFNGRVLNYRKNVEQKQARKEKKLRKLEEESYNFHELQDEDKSNLEVPKTALEVNTSDGYDENVIGLKKKNKKKKRQHSNESYNDINVENECTEENTKKKKYKDDISMKTDNGAIDKINDVNDSLADEQSLKRSKKKKRKGSESDITMPINEDCFEKQSPSDDTSLLKSKKKKRNHKESEVDENNGDIPSIKKYNKKHEIDLNESFGDMDSLRKNKKKKHDKDRVNKNSEASDTEAVNENSLENTLDEEVKKTSKKNHKKKDIGDEREDNLEENHNDVSMTKSKKKKKRDSVVDQ